MKITIRNFTGIIPRFSPELLPDNAGQTANNMSLKSGKIYPEKPFNISTPDRDYVPGQINDDPYRRLYYLDDNGTLCVAGTFPDASGTTSTEISCRKVGMSAPDKPQIISVSSPFLDSIGASMDGAVMVANYRDAYAGGKAELGHIIYAKRELEPVAGSSWSVRSDGSVSRIYKFCPYHLSIYIP